MTSTSGWSPKARNLGAELRECRKEAHVSERAMAPKMDVTRVQIQRWERGENVLTVAEVKRFLCLLDVSADDQERITALAADVDAQNWATSESTRTELTTLVELERNCVEMVNVSPLLVPGLLQTDDYIRAVMGNDNDAENRVHLRLGRQHILAKRRNAPRYTVFISEGVLREPLGGPLIMADQIRHIIDVTGQKNITVRVIESGSSNFHPAHAGMFIVFRFPKASPIVHLEHLGAPTFLYNARDVQRYEDAEIILRDKAMSESDSIDLMEHIATTMGEEGERQ